MELLNQFIAWLNGSPAGERRAEKVLRFEDFLSEYHSEILPRLRLDYTPVFDPPLIEQGKEAQVTRAANSRILAAEARIAEARHVVGQVVFRCLSEAALLQHLENVNRSHPKATALRRELDLVRGGIAVHMHSFLRAEMPAHRVGIRLDMASDDTREKLGARQPAALQVYGNLISIGVHDATLPSRLHISTLRTLFQEFHEALLPSYFVARVQSRTVRNNLAEILDKKDSGEWDKRFGSGVELLPYDYDLRVWQEWHKNFRLGLAYRLAKIYHELVQENALSDAARERFDSLFPGETRQGTQSIFFREHPSDDSRAPEAIQVIEVESSLLVSTTISDAPEIEPHGITLPLFLHVPLTIHSRTVYSTDTNDVAYSFFPPFIEPVIEFWDFATYKTYSLTLQDYPSLVHGRCLMSAPPLGGKTRMHTAMMYLHQARQLGPVFYMDLEDFAYSGLSFFAYASRELSKQFQLERERVSWVQEKLFSADFANQIFWHLDGWDRISGEQKPNVAIRLRDLSQFLLSTGDPVRTRNLLESNRHQLSGIVRLLPFDETRMDEYIQGYVRLDDEVSAAPLQGLAGQLPNLAKLPGGLEHICTNAHLVDVVRVLFEFLNRTELSWNGHPINAAALVERDTETAFEKSRYVRAAYEIVKRSRIGAANTTIGETPRFTVAEFASKLEWLKEWEREKIAHTYFDLAERARILARIQDDEPSYQLNIPEIGYLFDAMASAQVNPLADLQLAHQNFSNAPDGVRARIDFAYATWRAQFFQLNKMAARQRFESSLL